MNLPPPMSAAVKAAVLVVLLQTAVLVGLLLGRM